jgi:hypothetical protein
LSHTVHALLQRECWIQLQHLGGPGVDEQVTRRGKVDFAGAGDLQSLKGDHLSTGITCSVLTGTDKPAAYR